MTHIQHKEVCLCRTGRAESAQIPHVRVGVGLVFVLRERDVIFFFFYKTPGRQTVNTKVVITLSREKKKTFSITPREFEQAWRKESEADFRWNGCPCLWVTDPCRREQHRNREHYSEIKVDLELLPHHLARAAGKSKQCWKWMNTQRG